MTTAPHRRGNLRRRLPGHRLRPRLPASPARHRLLPGVSVISGISGGSLLAALYAYGPQDFTDFDHTTTTLLRGGLQGALIRRALHPASGGPQSRCSRPRPPAPATRSAAPAPDSQPHRCPSGRTRAPRLRRPGTRPGNAPRPGHRHHGHRPAHRQRGQVRQPQQLMLGLRHHHRTGHRRRGRSRQRRLPPPAPRHRAHIHLHPAAGPQTKPARSAAHRRRDLRQPRPQRPGTRALRGPHRACLQRRLRHRLRRRPRKAPAGSRPFRRNPPAAKLQHRPPASPGRRPGQAPRRSSHRTTARCRPRLPRHARRTVPIPMADLVPAAKVRHYPTDFKAMAANDMQLITTRGEQLTRALLAHYCPGIL